MDFVVTSMPKVPHSVISPFIGFSRGKATRRTLLCILKNKITHKKCIFLAQLQALLRLPQVLPPFSAAGRAGGEGCTG